LIPRRRGELSRTAALAALLCLGACSPLKVLDETPTSVSFRYDGVAATLDDATAAANRYCAALGKVAHLRNEDTRGALDHFASFNCVGG
jgi:hypothetical protein